MQGGRSKDLPRSNRDRTEKTRTALMQAARALFVDKGYAETSTPEIVAAAGITRGALYHHFEDKRALFRAVVTDEALAVASAIELETPDGLQPVEALLKGSVAYLDAMRVTIPLQRLAKPEDMVGPYLFLASAALSGYMTGQVLEVNGGQLMT